MKRSAAVPKVERIIEEEEEEAISTEEPEGEEGTGDQAEHAAQAHDQDLGDISQGLTITEITGRCRHCGSLRGLGHTGCVWRDAHVHVGALFVDVLKDLRMEM